MNIILLVLMVPVVFLMTLSAGTNSGKEKSKSLEVSEAILFIILLTAAGITKMIS